MANPELDALIASSPKTMSTLGLAKKALSLGYSKSLDGARQAVRWRRGEMRRSKGTFKKEPMSPRSDVIRESCRIGGHGIPEPFDEGFRVVQLPHEIKHWLILADIHAPFHDAEALNAMLKWAKKRTFDGILFNGDTWDDYSLSNFVKNPIFRNLKEELNTAHNTIKAICRSIQPKHVVFKSGNHERRLEVYVQRNAPELFEVTLETVNVRTLLRLDEAIPKRCALTMVEQGNPIRHGRLSILHGDEWAGGWTSPVNPARSAFLKSGECCLVAHEHRTSSHTEVLPLSGTNITCFSSGCLCQLHPRYRPLNKWNHGFSTLRSGHNWDVGNYRIIKGNVF